MHISGDEPVQLQRPTFSPDGTFSRSTGERKQKHPQFPPKVVHTELLANAIPPSPAHPLSLPPFHFSPAQKKECQEKVQKKFPFHGHVTSGQRAKYLVGIENESPQSCNEMRTILLYLLLVQTAWEQNSLMSTWKMNSQGVRLCSE